MPTQHLFNYNFDKVYVGMSREQFSVVEFSHSVLSVCQMFWQFVKFIVVVSEVEEALASKRHRLDASDNEPNCLKVPSLISKEKNRKDGLYNDYSSSVVPKMLGGRNQIVTVKGLCQIYRTLYGVLMDPIMYYPVAFDLYQNFLPMLLDTIGQNEANIGRDLSPI